MQRSLFFLFLLFISKKSLSQVLNDIEALNKIKEGITYIYNMEFTKAQSIYGYLINKYADHPACDIYNAIIIYWKNYPLIPEKPASKDFERILKNAINKVEAKYKINPENPENIICGIGSYGLLLLYYSDNGITNQVINYSISGYKYVNRSFKFLNEYPDFYFVTGLYNYYIEAYPQKHPIYKPVTIIFPSGDKEIGLKHLKIATKKAIFLKAEAYNFLSNIYLNFELNYKEALEYTKELYNLYPNNDVFLFNYIKMLLINKDYKKALELTEKLSNENFENKFFLGQYLLYKAIIYEKYYKNYNEAEIYYQKSYNVFSLFNPFANELTSYSLFGLSRISQNHLNDIKSAKIYRKNAEKLCKYKHITFDD